MYSVYLRRERVLVGQGRGVGGHAGDGRVGQVTGQLVWTKKKQFDIMESIICGLILMIWLKVSDQLSSRFFLYIPLISMIKKNINEPLKVIKIREKYLQTNLQGEKKLKELNLTISE